MPDTAVKDLQEKMIQLGIFVIGDQYYIKIEEVEVQLPRFTRISEALSYLVMFYYVLDLKYPNPLKTVFIFLEYLFGIAPSCHSEKAKRTSGYLLCQNEN